MRVRRGQRASREGLRGTYGSEAEHTLSFDLFGEASNLEVLRTKRGTPLRDTVTLAVDVGKR